MVVRKATVNRKLDFYTVQRRRNLKSEKSRNNEADRILRQVLKRVGGEVVKIDAETDEDLKFGLDLSNLDLKSLPYELFEDEFLNEKCEKYLHFLNVKDNSITLLDKEIGDFVNLVSIDCANNR